MASEIFTTMDLIMDCLAKGPMCNAEVVRATGETRYKVRWGLLRLVRENKIQLVYDPFARRGWWKYRIIEKLRRG